MKLLISFVFIYFKACNVYADNCSHFQSYPTYSEMQLQNFSLSAWDKPWAPEIDWLDSYLNLSSFPEYILEGLLNGYKITKRVQYYSDPDTGCWMYFDYDLKLAKKHYFEHYANTNKTMLICFPDIPMRPDVYFNLTRQNHFLVWCFPEDTFLEGTWDYIWKTHTLGLSLVFSAGMVIIITGLTGNILILRAISSNKELQTPTNLFLASLAVTDLLIAVFMPIDTIYWQYFKLTVRLTLPGCILREIVGTTLYVSSVYHLTAISFERFFAICYPMKVKSICTTRKAKIVIPILWIIATSCGFPYFLIMTEIKTTSGYYCTPTSSFLVSYWYTVGNATTFALLFLLPFSLIAHNYARIGGALFKSLKENVHLQEGIQTQDHKLKEETGKRVKVVKMLVAVMVIFVLCWTPVILFEFWEAINKIFTQVSGSRDSIHATRMWLQLLSHVNSCANAVIYYLTSDQFRKAFQQQLICWRRKDSTNSGTLHVLKVRKRKRKCDRISVKVISTGTDTNNCTDLQ